MLLPILAIVGIITAPLATPAAAGMMAAGHMTEMADDMPCCPDGKPVMPDCAKACPLMMVCLSKAFRTVSGVTGALPALALVAVIIPADEAMRDGLVQPPPARPPRSIA